MRRYAQFVLEAVGLQTARGRVAVSTILHGALFVVPYAWLEAAHLSLYERAGIPSPSIGLTRSYWYMLHGNVSAAWEKNRLIFIVAPVILTILLIDIRRLLVKNTQTEVSF